MCCLIADIERELLGCPEVLVFEDTGVLQTEGTTAQPIMLPHSADKDAFGWCARIGRRDRVLSGFVKTLVCLRRWWGRRIFDCSPDWRGFERELPYV